MLNTQTNDIDTVNYENEVINPRFIHADIHSETALSEKAMKLSIYLSTLKTFPNEDTKEHLSSMFQIISQLKILQEDKTRKNFQLVSNLICCFVDIMRIYAPDIAFENEILNFYIDLLLSWLEDYSMKILDIPPSYELKFDYLIERLGKSNMLSLMINIGRESEIQDVIQYFLTIQGEKNFEEKSANFQSIANIIKGLIEEMNHIPKPILNYLLINFNKQSNRGKYNMCNHVLKLMKNILSTPINQLIFQMITTDTKERTDDIEIMKIRDEEFLRLIKSLSKISDENLITILSSIPANDSNTLIKTKIKGVSYLELLMKIFGTPNSLQIAKDYSHLFNKYIDVFSAKNIKENDKYKIFRSLLKFILLNNKRDMKSNNIYFLILEKFQTFFTEIKTESNGINVINTISDFIFKKAKSYFKVPWKVISLTQTFLDCKFPGVTTSTIDLFFLLIQKRIFPVASLFDLFSEDKRRLLNKVSFLFNSILLKTEGNQLVRNYFKEKLFDIVNMSKLSDTEGANVVYDFGRIIVIIFFFSLNDHKANNLLHKYMLQCFDYYFLIFSQVNQYTQENSCKETLLNSISNALQQDIQIETTIKIAFDANKNYDSNLNVGVILQLSKLLDEETLQIVKQALTFPFNLAREVTTLVEFGMLLLQSIDETNTKSNDLLNSLLSVIIYYIKFNANIFIQKKKEEKEEMIIIPECHLTGFHNILNLLFKIINQKIVDRNVANYVLIIVKLYFDLRDITEFSEIELKVNRFILNDLSSLCLENAEIPIKSLAKIIYDLTTTLSLSSNFENSQILPNQFSFYLFQSDNKLNSLKLLCELLKLDVKDSERFGSYGSLFFKENIRDYILYDLKETTGKNIENMREELMKTAGKEDEDHENEINTTLSNIKKELIRLTSIQHEILKYEFYFLLSINSMQPSIGIPSPSKDKEKQNRLFHQFAKGLLTNVYELLELEKKHKESLDNPESAKVLKLFKLVNTLSICKYTNLIFKFFEHEIPVKTSLQVKLCNIALHKDLVVRDHLLKKIEKIITGKNKISLYLHAIPILCLYFNDPDKSLKQKATHLFSNFISFLMTKLSQYKESEKEVSSRHIYRYIPDIYISYIFVYAIFNPNFNLLYRSGEKKYCECIIISYLKLLKKITSNHFDSSFLVQMCVKMKNSSLKNKKVIKKISSETYLSDLIKSENIFLTSENYEEVKTGLCSVVIQIITMDYTTAFRYEDIKPHIPLIFLTEKDTSIALSNVKSAKKEQHISYFSENIDISKIEQGGNQTMINNHNSIINATNQSIKSNAAVKDHELRFNQVRILFHVYQTSSKNKSSELLSQEKDCDEFENLPKFKEDNTGNENESKSKSAKQKKISESTKSRKRKQRDNFENEQKKRKSKKMKK